jgi:ketol-acid reductoisomerase
VTSVFHEEHATLEPIEGLTLAIVGYGNQGRSQALNLRDSGCDVVVGNIDDAYRATAVEDGFVPVTIAEASERASVVFMLVPDEVMSDIYERDVAPHLREGDTLVFAHGYNVGFGLIEPPTGVDVVMIAPRMIGAGVRDSFVSGKGFPSFVGVHQDATGRARERMLALCLALGSLRAGCIEMSFVDEATLDLFTEQAFGPAFGAMLRAAVETLVEAGFPPEAVLMELYLSGELAYSLEKGREMGMRKQHELHSHTSQYGTITRAPRFFQLAKPAAESMQEILEEIRSGAFAREWSTDREGKLELLEKARQAADQVPMSKWEDAARRVFRIGDAATK